MTGKFFSPGKLLLTSEYVVLDGALSLAVPTQLGQELHAEEAEDGISLILWEAYIQDEIWLKVVIDYKKWRVLEATDSEKGKFLLQVFKEIKSRSKVKLQGSATYHLMTNLQFPENFGLGSSSTFINNLADWSQTDAFELNEATFGGSGYDIAVALEKKPILFQNLPEGKVSKATKFKPAFANELMFVHLNRKQNSREGIQHYRSKKITKTFVNKFSTITRKVLRAKSLEEFSVLMEQHEEILSKFIDLPKVKDSFPDYPFFVKSLGAWGGDFVLTVKNEESENYFKQRNYENVYSWGDLIL